jgi:hypothetical protein
VHVIPMEVPLVDLAVAPTRETPFPTPSESARRAPSAGISVSTQYDTCSPRRYAIGFLCRSLRASFPASFERFTGRRLSYLPATVKLRASPGKAGGLPVVLISVSPEFSSAGRFPGSRMFRSRSLALVKLLFHPVDNRRVGDPVPHISPTIRGVWTLYFSIQMNCTYNYKKGLTSATETTKRKRAVEALCELDVVTGSPLSIS